MTTTAFQAGAEAVKDVQDARGRAIPQRFMILL